MGRGVKHCAQEQDRASASKRFSECVRLLGCVCVCVCVWVGGWVDDRVIG